MKSKPRPHFKKGFTLIELLTVIAIIGILAAIIIPAVGNVRVKAAQAASASDLKNIATSYNSFAIAGARSRTIGDGAWAEGQTSASTPAEWAQVLAEFAELNDGSIYFISSADDVAGIAVIPKVILTGDPVAPTADWTSAADEISYSMAVNISPNAPASVTPIIWTKGLETDGTWDPDRSISPWGDDGGHIAFADGHVQFYKTTEDELIDPVTGDTTTNIETAVGSTNIVETN
ncbi:MAG: prepilin-type N-terminal cleavage/methylation domain-containing protein [Verrucomicrobiota bacterium]